MVVCKAFDIYTEGYPFSNYDFFYDCIHPTKINSINEQIYLSSRFLCLNFETSAQNQVLINADLGKDVISENIYGHFAAHFGSCIYGGFCVGENQLDYVIKSGKDTLNSHNLSTLKIN